MNRYERAVAALDADVIRQMAAELPDDMDLEQMVQPGAQGKHSNGFATVVNAKYDSITAGGAGRPSGAVADALLRAWREGRDRAQHAQH